ncbi:MAG: ATP-binding cassette domain-containing protein [Proteobacteria bacterium]|nr:ATP-binding cassette domain-containing protein [Pseudomonadota bacterium]MBU1686392.1 ATP-binding cassette domain-containing protein [Pseudomonadota bacterium]
MVPPALQAEGVVKQYPGGGAPAVEGFDVTVRQGELFGLLGPNGAGKTTVISMMTTILKPSGGEMHLLGFRIGSDNHSIKKCIGLVPQEIALFQEMTAQENLWFFGRLYGLSGARLRERIADCLEFIGLTDRGNQKVITYSGGMKRRLNLAAGILHEPQLLFLDEPTVGIDAQSRNLIMEKLLDLNRCGMTMVYTTHYMEEVERLCCRVAIMDRGRVIGEGSPRELINQGGCMSLEELFLSMTGKRLRD